jgi:serine/threonine-protein kinase RsbW
MDQRGRRSVRLSIPAHPRMLRFARVTAATLAVDLAFTLEEIEDLRVAVDELAAAAIEGLDDSAVLDLCFEIDGNDLVVDGRVLAAGPTPELHPVAQELIKMLTDDHEFAERDGNRTFRLVKHGGIGP